MWTNHAGRFCILEEIWIFDLNRNLPFKLSSAVMFEIKIKIGLITSNNTSPVIQRLRSLHFKSQPLV